MTLYEELTAEFRMEEASGDLTDSKNSLVLTDLGDNVYQQTGLIGYAIQGTQNGGTASDLGFSSSSDSFDIDGEDWSVSFWFNRGTSTNTHYVLSKWISNTGAAFWYCYVDDTGCRMRGGGGDGNDFTYAYSFSSNTWHHVVWTFDASTYDCKLYIDGVYKASWTFGAAYTTNAADFIFNALKQSTTYYMGDSKMDLFQFFNGYILTDGGVSTSETAGGDIATLYNSGDGFELGESADNAVFFGGGV